MMSVTFRCSTAYSSTDNALRSLPGTKAPTFLCTNTSPGLHKQSSIRLLKARLSTIIKIALYLPHPEDLNCGNPAVRTAEEQELRCLRLRKLIEELRVLLALSFHPISVPVQNTLQIFVGVGRVLVRYREPLRELIAAERNLTCGDPMQGLDGQQYLR
jgi:hypothetical protein